MMKTKRVLCMVCVLLFVLAALVPVGAASAADSKSVSYVNPETGFRAEIRDDIKLLTESDRTRLLESMKPITQFGHIGFVSTDISASSALEQARNIRKEMFGMDSGSVFVINMKERQLTIQSYGTLYRYISSSKARSITDNVHGYATNGDYYSAAAEAYRQMTEVINGNKIAEPMRFYSYAMIALMIGMIVAIGIVFLTRFNPNIKDTDEEQMNAAELSNLIITQNVLTSRVTIRTITRSSGGGGGCGGGGCGGGGGGCGGGGGSSF